MSDPQLHVIGELMNNSYARARRGFTSRAVAEYQNLARIQAGLGAAYLTLNLDDTQQVQVRLPEMLDFLPDVIAAIQEVTDVPLSFDNPALEYHAVALEHYDRTRSGPPILNSVAASRARLDGMIDLVKHHDTHVVVMASEQFVPDVTRAGRRPDQLMIDPGLAPVGADTYGLVNIGLDAMRLIAADPALKGVHMVVGLSNFAWGTPKGVREQLEQAYLTLAMEVGLDFALANPEKAPRPLPPDHPIVGRLRAALAAGRPVNGESQETAGFRQAEAIMAICTEFSSDDD
jgi:5-methyltetrahydrofolate--homocysteine methyltransferase